MSLSDCIKCWSNPCECGHDYEHWDVERLESLRDILQNIITSKTEEDEG
jgi:hypothetical protein